MSGSWLGPRTHPLSMAADASKTSLLWWSYTLVVVIVVDEERCNNGSREQKKAGYKRLRREAIFKWCWKHRSRTLTLLMLTTDHWPACCSCCRIIILNFLAFAVFYIYISKMSIAVRMYINYSFYLNYYSDHNYEISMFIRLRRRTTDRWRKIS